METVLITGGTGMLGNALTQALIERGYSVIVLTRDVASQQSADSNISFAEWNIKNRSIDKSAIEKADHIIHLAGASVAEKRWTKKRKKEIVDSRVESGKLIVESLKTIPNKVRTVISISGIGWYGPDPQIPNPNPFAENDPVDNSFLGDTCRQWEAAVEPVAFMGKRLIKFRTGIVLSNEGGLILELKKPLRFGFATILGNGKQIVSWIHIDDLVRMFMYALETIDIEGVYNAVAPNSVSNKEITINIAKQSGKFFIPAYVPSILLKIALGELSIEVLKSATVSADRIQNAGFIFQYPRMNEAIEQLAAVK